ncbi:MAG: tetratricopeptide repeat protein [Cyclobacteriaceae bacterium]
MRGYLISVFILACFWSTYGQEHPLSKSDSGIIIVNLQKYEVLKAESNYRGASEALNNAAFVFWNNNHYAKAAEYYELSHELNQKVANENGMAMINNNLGMLYSDLGEYEKSLDNFNKTLAARRAGKEPIGVISALINIGVVLNNLGRYDESIVHLLEALDISRELYDKHQMRSVYGMLSETYEKQGDIVKSLQYFELYKTFHEEIQRSEVKELNQELQQERIEKELAEAEKAKQENELLKRQLELLEQQIKLAEIDSINQTLYSSLTRKEVELELLERDKELIDLEAKSRKIENEKLQNESTYLKIGFLVFFIASAIIVLLISININKTKKHNKALAQKNEAIEKQRAELELANHTKDRIFSILAHDLRSPMTSLQGFLKYIDHIDVSTRLKEAFKSVQSQLTNNSSLLENLLLWSRTQLDNSPPQVKDVCVSQVIEDTFRLLGEQADKKNISLNSSISKEDSITSDADSIMIVVRNVVQNAIKFTREGGSIDIDFSSDDQWKRINIQDSGIGMDQEKINSLFDIKTNRTSKGTKDETGSGLGMILCKELMERINAVIEVTSEVGKGSLVSLKFPIKV